LHFTEIRNRLTDTVFEHPLLKLTALIVFVLLGSSVGYFFFEGQGESQEMTLFDAFWWAVVTLTTVGYGDVVPATTGGRIMGVVVMFCGIGLVSTLTGNLASMLVVRQTRKRKGLLMVNLSRHAVIVGWNTFGLDLAMSLVANAVGGEGTRGHLVLVNTLPQDERDAIAAQLDLGERLHFVFGNVTQLGVLKKAMPDRAAVVYLLPRGDLAPKDAEQEILYSALALRELAPRVPLYGEVLMPESRHHLLRAGVDQAVVRGELGSRLLAMMGTSPSIWMLVNRMFGVHGASLVGYRLLTAEEKQGTWGGLMVDARLRNELPLGLCRLSTELSLEDVLDEGAALDGFILELFRSFGQKTSLGSSGPEVVPNPGDDTNLRGFDALLYLKAGGES